MLKDTNHNQLIIRIQPDEAVRLKMNAKMPGLELRTVTTELDLSYQRTVENPDIPEAYESLLLDAFKGDYSESVSEQELEASWKIFTPLLHELEGNQDIIPMGYAYGNESSPSPFWTCLGVMFAYELTTCQAPKVQMASKILCRRTSIRNRGPPRGPTMKYPVHYCSKPLPVFSKRYSFDPQFFVPPFTHIFINRLV